MTVKISFADLTHMGQVVAANTFPLGSTMVASYAKQELGDEIDVEVFKYPDDFANYLDKGMPQFAGFSTFSWNNRLAHEYAKRIKAVSSQDDHRLRGSELPPTLPRTRRLSSSASRTSTATSSSKASCPSSRSTGL